MRGARLLSAIYSQPWAITPEVGAQMLAVVHRWSEGMKLSEDEIRIAIESATHRPSEHPVAAQGRSDRIAAGGGSVAVIQVLGVISPRSEVIGNISAPGMSAEGIQRRFQAAMNDDEVGAIVLDIESPGGTAFGIAELASEIMAGRKKKPVYAVANAAAASAAYWIGSAASVFAATPSSQTGSIGVYSAHEDLSAALEKDGVKVTLVASQGSPFKTERNPFAPMGDEARAHLQAMVDQYYDSFVRDVAAGRNVPLKKVRGDFGGGRTFGAEEALARGMVDRIATLDEIMSEAKAKATRRPVQASGRSAAAARLDLL